MSFIKMSGDERKAMLHANRPFHFTLDYLRENGMLVMDEFVVSVTGCELINVEEFYRTIEEQVELMMVRYNELAGKSMADPDVFQELVALDGKLIYLIQANRGFLNDGEIIPIPLLLEELERHEFQDACDYFLQYDDVQSPLCMARYFGNRSMNPMIFLAA